MLLKQATPILFIGFCMLCSCMLPTLVCGVTPPNDNCKFTLVESIPQNLTYPPGVPISMSTYAAHKHLMSLATRDIHIASFYWALTGSDVSYVDPSDYEGEDIFKSLQGLLKRGTVDVRIAQNAVNNDTDDLAKAGAQVRSVNFTRLMSGGVLHTKLWVVDSKHLYVGSANFDWRSYTQVKETGILIENCSEIVSDMDKIFEVYWYLGNPNATIPKTWPDSYNTNINAISPLPLMYNNSKGLVYLSSSPPPFCPSGRTTDIDAILSVISAAREFIYISVMDYIPLFLYQEPKRFWPVIDDALRKVAYENKIKIFVMSGCWKHTYPEMFVFFKSLRDLSEMKHVDIQIKYFTVPASPSQAKIPFARVNHSKFMVTDQHAYIGTSNWSADYFIYSGGVGFILQEAKKRARGCQSGSDFRQQLEDAFKRDWYSKYASSFCKI